MCNIILFKPGQKMSMDKLANCVYNNWHSFGLVTLHPNDKMEILRVVPENGELNPEDVYKALMKDADRPRILHLRHNTAGATNLENTHPFDVLYQTGKDGHHLVFMHNGTLYEHKSKKTDEKGVVTDDDDGPSDTKNFVDNVLIPYFANCREIDINSPVFWNYMKGLWPTTGNRGVIISNKQNPRFFGDWKKFDDEGEEFTVANVDYFDKVTRGPEFVRREMKKKSEGGKNLPAMLPKVADFRDYVPKEVKNFFSLADDPTDILEDWDIYHRDGMRDLGLLTVEELQQIATRPSIAHKLMEWTFGEFSKIVDEIEELEDNHADEIKKLEEKNARASKMIEQLKKQVKDAGTQAVQ